MSLNIASGPEGRPSKPYKARTWAWMRLTEIGGYYDQEGYKGFVRVEIPSPFEGRGMGEGG